MFVQEQQRYYLTYSWAGKFRMVLFYGTSTIVGYFNAKSIFIQIKLVKLSPLVEGDPKAPFSIATTPSCWGGHYSFPWIAPLYT